MSNAITADLSSIKLPEPPIFPREEYERAKETATRLQEQLAGWNAQIEEFRAALFASCDAEYEEEDIDKDPEEFKNEMLALLKEYEEVETDLALLDVHEALQGVDDRCKGADVEMLRACLGQLAAIVIDIERKPHLDEHREELLRQAKDKQSTLRESIEEHCLVSLRESLKKVKWPSSESCDYSEFLKTSKAALNIYVGSDLPPILNVFRALAEPLESRFLYHFNSKRPTNRLDKPEWFFQHVVATIEEHDEFMRKTIQPLLQNFPDLNAGHEFIRSLLPMVITKVQSCSRQIVNETDLLTHLIAQAKIFDDTLRDDFAFRARDGYWTGTARELLSDDVFEAWLEAEDEFVKIRYHEIVDDLDAFEIPSDADSRDVYANRASMGIIELFDAMSRQFSPVENLLQRKDFVDTVQKALLDSFFEKIRSSTEAYEQLTSGFSGGFPTIDISGLQGLQRLFRQLSGVVAISGALLDWSDDPYYIECNTEPCFSTQIKDYSTLRERIEKLIVSHLERDLSSAMKAYAKIHTWHSDQAPLTQVASTNPTSPQLHRLYEEVNVYMKYITSVSSTTQTHRIYRALAGRLDDYLWQNVILRNKFSRRGALQLKRDVWELWATFLKYVGAPERGMMKVSDTLTVLSDGTDADEMSALKSITDATTTHELRATGIKVLSLDDVHLLLNNKLFEI